MKTMFEYDLVRRLHYRQGLSRHEIARRTGLHSRAINRMPQYARRRAACCAPSGPVFTCLL